MSIWMPCRGFAVFASIVTVALAPDAGAQGPAGDLGFTVPAGYLQQKQGDLIILAPANAGPESPCVYGLAGRLAYTGSLEAAAEAALTQVVVPGWQRLDDRHAAMRGTSADGWPYVWYRAAFRGNMNGQQTAVNAMALVLPAGPGQVHLVWSMGNIAHCLADDATFEALFHSLHPPAWTPDGGQALTKAMAGTWRFTAGSAGMHQLTFRPDGRYARDLGTTARVGVMETTSSQATDGRFALRNGELTLTADHRPQAPDRYRVRVYDEWYQDRWKPAMTLVNAGITPPTVVQYYRVD
jgi:hypothetical protein